MADIGEPAGVDRASSDACTRSGGFALLLSIALLLLIPYWSDRPKMEALGLYLTSRFNLMVDLQSLDDEPFWQEHPDAYAKAESMSIEQLTESSDSIFTSVEETSKTKPKNVAPQMGKAVSGEPLLPGASAKGPSSKKSKISSSNGTSKDASNTLSPTPSQMVGTKTAPPLPPTNVRAEAVGGEGNELYDIPRVVDVLKKLNNSEMLSRSLQTSNYIDASIVRWVTKRNSLVYRNLAVGKCVTNHLEVPYAGKPSLYYVPALYPDAMLKCLTLKDVKELADFESPTAVYNPPQLGEHISGQVDINPGSLPRDPFLASILVQALLFFVITYFGVFARECTSMSNFPSPGTLFGAFSKTRAGLLIFLLAMWSPFGASFGVAVTAHKWPMYLCTCLVLYAVLSVHIVLQKRSYWALLMNRSKLIAGPSPSSLPAPHHDQS